MKDKNFENILEDCLERLLAGGETVEDCLNAYPQHASALKSLLQTALLTKNATEIEPRPEFKASARYQFRIALQEAASKKNRSFSAWRFRWATALTSILVMLMAGGGLVFAAGTSMPDNPLYSVKLAVEQMQLNLTFSDLGKANLHAEFADIRISEIISMAQKGDTGQVMAGIDLLGNHFAMIANLTANSNKTLQEDKVFNDSGQSAPELENPLATTPWTDIRTQKPVTGLPPALSIETFSQDSFAEGSENYNLFMLLLQDGVKNSAALRDLLATVPESVKPALLEVIAILDAGYTNVINATIE